MTLRVVVLGAGFGGLELSTRFSKALGDSIDLTLIDRMIPFSSVFRNSRRWFGL